MGGTPCEQNALGARVSPAKGSWLLQDKAFVIDQRGDQLQRGNSRGGIRLSLHAAAVLTHQLPPAPSALAADLQCSMP